MQRIARAFAVTLSLIALLGLAPGILAKQEQQGPIFEDDESSFSEGITVTPLDEGSDQFQVFNVDFDAGAYIPERTYPESMVIKIQSGTFAFRVQSEVIVDPQGEDLVVLEADPAIPLGSNPDDNHLNRVFTPNPTVVPLCQGIQGQELCLLDPDVLGENLVELKTGYAVYLPDNSTCFICNSTLTGDETASLLVWAPSSGFSWHDLDAANLSSRPRTMLVEDPGLQPTRGWMFNPGTNCK